MPTRPSRDGGRGGERTSYRILTADSYVRARIDTATKERAAAALEAMGLSISDAIREVIREAIRLQRDRDAVYEERREQLRRGIEEAYQDALKGDASSGDEVRERLQKSRRKRLREQKSEAVG